MPKKATPQMAATFRWPRPLGRGPTPTRLSASIFARSCGERSFLEVGPNIASQLHEGDHEHQDHEGRQAKTQGDIADAARLDGGIDVFLQLGAGHSGSSSTLRPSTASASKAANRANR